MMNSFKEFNRRAKPHPHRKSAVWLLLYNNYYHVLRTITHIDQATATGGLVDKMNQEGDCFGVA